MQKKAITGTGVAGMGCAHFLHKQTDFTIYEQNDCIGGHIFNANLAKVKSFGFDDTFINNRNYYLSYCEAASAMRNINVMHLVYTRPNNTLR